MNTDMNVDICTGIAADSNSNSSSGSGCNANTNTNTSGSSSYGFVGSSSSTEETRGIRRVGDTFAIEIKPKQGWLQLPSDVSDLFDLMPAAAAAREGDETIEPAQLTCEPLMSECKCRCRYCSMQQLKVSATLQNIFACHLTCHSLTPLLSSPLSSPLTAANWQNQTIERLLSIGALFRVS